MWIKLNISKNKITVFLLAILITIFKSPAISRTLGETYILPIVAVYILINFNFYLKLDSYERNTLMLILLYILIILIYKIIGLSDASLSNYFTTLKFFLCFVIIIPAHRILNKIQIILLLVVTITTMFITMQYNIYLHNIWGFMYSIQLYATSSVKGVMNTQYTSAILLASGAFFTAFLQYKQWVIRCLFFALTAFCVYFNFTVTQRGIILFLSILMFPLLIIFNTKMSRRKMISFIILIPALLFSLIRYDVVLRWLSSAIGSERLSRKINAVINLIAYRNIRLAGDTLDDRYDLIITSVRTFFRSFSNFFIGVGDIRSNNLIVGNHSFFVDELARYGIITGLFSYYLLFRMLKIDKKMSGVQKYSVLNRQFNILLLVFVLRGFIGTIFDPSIGVCMFITVPLLFRLLSTEGEIAQ